MQVFSDGVLAEQLRNSMGPESPVRASLSTNQRVIARVTDGIYREPGSAIRELISNAYDADATRVIVKTDAPRFSRISVEDNGRGMSPEALAYLVKNIGGSAKRTDVGQALGISRADDPSRSPEGRKLIGKLGIGIFSVSQLTRSFQIVTKIEGDYHRSVALVRLHQYSDADDVSSTAVEYEAGEVTMWRESTTDVGQHGTSIVLTAIRPQMRDSLRSADIWDALDNVVAEETGSSQAATFVPRYHIGRIDENQEYREDHAPGLMSVPWEVGDAPRSAFRKMIESVWEATNAYNPNPALDSMFDNYLKMVWDLSLSVPVEYSHGHLFDENADGWAGFYHLSNEPRGRATKLDPEAGQRVRDLLALKNGEDKPLEFRVFMDDLELLRPIKYRNLPTTAHALKKPLVFLGKMNQDFEGIAASASGGSLAFEAYLFWTPKVAPVDHRGVLVRIHDSSGALFDHTFFRYQVSEQTRLRQIVCEVFVSEGLESALNIDREAFNTSHPHMVILTKWLHGALRQLATAQKAAAQVIRTESRERLGEYAQDRLRAIVEEANSLATDGEGLIPDVQFGSTPDSRPDPIERGLQGRQNVAHSFGADVLRPNSASRTLEEREVLQLKAIVQLLSLFGVLDALTDKQQERLVRSIAEVIRTSD